MANNQSTIEIEHIHDVYKSTTTIINKSGKTKQYNLSNAYDIFIPKWLNHDALIPAVIIVHGFQTSREHYIGKIYFILHFIFNLCYILALLDG